MRLLAPENFSVSEFYKDIYTFQSWDIFPGMKTAGAKDVNILFDSLSFPNDLTGRRVLEIAPWNGFFGFECLRRGADSVVCLGPDDPDITGFNKTVSLLEIESRTQYIRDSIYNLKNYNLGRFDIILFLGLIYHLRYPLLALDLVYEYSSDLLFLDTPVIDSELPRIDIDEEKKVEINSQLSVLRTQPLLYFSKSAETGDSFNWFFPNVSAMVDILISSGFEPFSVNVDSRSWCTIGCNRVDQLTFVKGLEGFNAGTAGWNGNNL